MRESVGKRRAAGIAIALLAFWAGSGGQAFADEPTPTPAPAPAATSSTDELTDMVMDALGGGAIAPAAGSVPAPPG
ncbi:hypothetical protein [Mycolicibacterium komossense]|uniref:Uncharacterized protein n=1 Tax=Mycolicibacterium komossense TaxID=1779 RepID=A0ABT3CEF5_9MYCO|nr:hypothetical protein [Mycolicibacterium komossense]MCV7227772.1 hypothetical protein [Mycolicibacterium komossense]